MNSLVLRTVLLIIGFCLLYTNVWAQNPAIDVLKKLRNNNAAHLIGYDYLVYLQNNKTGKAEDSLVGHLYKVNEDYLDSNGSSICIKSADYYAKLDLLERSALVFSVESLEAKLGGKLDYKPVMLDISDSVILKYGKLTAKKLSNGNDCVHITFRDQVITSITVEMQSKSGQIISMQMVTDEKDKYGDASGHSRLFLMRNFKYRFDTNIVSTERFFRKDKNKITLVNKYAKYKLNTITN